MESSTIGYTAAAVAITGSLALAGNYIDINDSKIKKSLVGIVGIASITAVGLAFGSLPAITLGGFGLGCFIANRETTKLYKVDEESTTYSSKLSFKEKFIAITVTVITASVGSYFVSNFRSKMNSLGIFSA